MGLYQVSKPEPARDNSQNALSKFFGFIGCLACVVTALGLIAYVLNVKFDLYKDAEVLLQITPWLLKAPIIALAASLVSYAFRRKVAGCLLLLLVAAGLVLVMLFPEVIGLDSLLILNL